MIIVLVMNSTENSVTGEGGGGRIELRETVGRHLSCVVFKIILKKTRKKIFAQIVSCENLK